MKRTCKKCNKEKLLELFTKNSKCRYGYRWICKECMNKWARKWKNNHKETTRAYSTKWKKEHPREAKEYQKEYRSRPEVRKRDNLAFKRRRAKIRNMVIQHYGGRCICCGETEPLFLSLDHINNDGASHRKKIGVFGGAEFYEWVLKNKFPARLQILCHNCNIGKHRNGGFCPHKIAKGEVRESA